MKAADARVLITGAAGGIGAASAEALLRAGATVMLVGRSGTRLQELASQLRQASAASATQVDHTVADLTNLADLSALATQASAWRCNVLVHNAGLPSFGRLQDATPDEVAAVMQTNLIAPMLLTRSLLPHLLAQRAAQVICVGSTLGAIGLPGYSVYSASKFGLRGFAQALRRELAETPVKVQYLGPRATRTGFNSEAAEAYNRATGTHSDRPERVAAELITLLESGAGERFVGYPEKIAARLNGLAPSLLDGSLRRHSRHLQAAGHARPALNT
jgi:short-subunit dehydrogenase